MKNAMQLKAIIKNISKENFSAACHAELHVGAFVRENFYFKVSS